MKRGLVFLLFLPVFFLFGGLHAADSSYTNVFPGEDWTEVSPESQGVDSTKLNEALNYFRANLGMDGITEVVIIRNGYMIWKGNNIDKKHRIWSVTKVFTSTVLGLLVEDGKCTPDSLARNFVSSLTSQYPNVTLEHFATMTSGYDAVGGAQWGDYLDGSETPWLPTNPFFEPGAAYLYWDDATNMMGHVLTQIAEEPMYTLFQRRIADPIDMDSTKWSWGDFGTVDGFTLNHAAGGIEISARALARLGHLYLNSGNWNGNQLLEERWVDEATRNHVPVSIPLFKDINPDPEKYTSHMDIDCRGIYGYYWWVNGTTPSEGRSMPDAPLSTYYGIGHNDNFLIIVPEWNMIIVRLGLDQTIDDHASILNNFLRIIGEGIKTDLVYTPVTPCRIVDTRLAEGAIPPGGIRSYNVYGAVASQGGNSAGCPSPKGEPRAVHVNVTSVPLGNGWITAYPFGSTAPTASIVNYRSDAQNVANSVTMKTCLSCAKDINIKSGGGTTHLVIDVLGYYFTKP